MIHAFSDGLEGNRDHVVVTKFGKRLGLVNPFEHCRILDVSWDDTWLVVLARDENSNSEMITAYRLDTLEEVSRVKTDRHAQRLSVVSGTNLVGVGIGEKVLEIRRLPDLENGWTDLPRLLIDRKGKIQPFLQDAAYPQKESVLALRFPLFRTARGEPCGTFVAKRGRGAKAPYAVGLMDIDFDNRRLTPRALDISASKVTPLTSPSPCGGYILQQVSGPEQLRTTIYKGKFAQQDKTEWHRLRVEIRLIDTLDLNVLRNVHAADLAAPKPISANKAGVWAALKSRFSRARATDWIHRVPFCLRDYELVAHWPGHSEAFYINTKNSLRRISVDGAVGPWIHNAGIKSDAPVWASLPGRDFDVYSPVGGAEIPNFYCRALWETDGALWVENSGGSLQVKLSDVDRIVLKPGNHLKTKRAGLTLEDVAESLPCIAEIKSLEQDELKAGLEAITEDIRSNFGQMAGDHFKPFFRLDGTLMNEKAFFDLLEKEGIDAHSEVQGYVEGCLDGAEQLGYRFFDSEGAGAVSPALAYLLKRQNITSLVLRYLHNCDGSHAYYVRETLLRDLVETAWRDGFEDAAYIAMTEAATWFYSGAGMGSERPFEAFNLMDQCQKTVSPEEFATLLVRVATDFRQCAEDLAEECIEVLGESDWEKEAKQILLETLSKQRDLVAQ